jgi:hypothetical protein
VGKVKAKFSTRSLLKKTDKDNFFKKTKFSTSSILKKSIKIILKK